jgi:hypothetical protein
MVIPASQVTSAPIAPAVSSGSPSSSATVVPAGSVPTVSPVIPDQPKSRGKKVSQTGQKKAKWRPGTAVTAKSVLSVVSITADSDCRCRNLCAQEWLALHPNGNSTEFNEYFKQLLHEQKEVRFQDVDFQIFPLTILNITFRTTK